jgi:hypothetical protein
MTATEGEGEGRKEKRRRVRGYHYLCFLEAVIKMRKRDGARILS